jgi:hypothetical protein
MPQYPTLEASMGKYDDTIEHYQKHQDLDAAELKRYESGLWTPFLSEDEDKEGFLREFRKHMARRAQLITAWITLNNKD